VPQIEEVIETDPNNASNGIMQDRMVVRDYFNFDPQNPNASYAPESLLTFTEQETMNDV